MRKNRTLGMILLVLMGFSSISFIFLTGTSFAPAPSEVKTNWVDNKNATFSQIIYLLNQGKVVVIYERGPQDNVYEQFKNIVLADNFQDGLVVFSFNSSVQNNKVTIYGMGGEISMENVTLNTLVDLICANALRTIDYCILRRI